MSEVSTFSISTSVQNEQMPELLDQLRRYHLLLHPELFKGVRRGTVGGRPALAFTAVGGGGAWIMNVEVWVEDGLQVKVSSPDELPVQAVGLLRNDLTSVVRAIETNLENANITLIWVRGETIAPEEMPPPLKRLTSRLFSNALILLNILLFAFNIILFILIGFIAVIFILIVQLLFIIYSDRIFSTMGKWKITRENPQAYLLQISVKREVLEAIKDKKIDLVRLKQEIFEHSFARGAEPTCPVVSETLLRYGIFCAPENITTKVVNVYNLVERATTRFGVPMPKIVISNSLVPNAAASGATPKRGVLLITGGILAQLSEEELFSVIGHEIGHLKGRDPLFLYAIVSGEFILRVTILFPLFLFSPFIYLIIALFLIFFIAKFFEARADLLSAMVIGQPKVMAESLRKIGFQRLQTEENAHLRSWLRWDTHPPLYFRIERLENLPTPVVVKHPLLQSARDVLRGFRSAF